MDPLTVREHMTLEIISRSYRDPARFVAPARELVGMGEVRFHQVVNALIDRPAAEAAYPMLVRRLRRLRDLKQQQRTNRSA